jgi:hypothetical protein
LLDIYRTTSNVLLWTQRSLYLILKLPTVNPNRQVKGLATFRMSGIKILLRKL